MTKMYGPYDVDLKINVTDGERFAIVTYGIVQATDHENIHNALVESEAKVKKELGDQWRLCTKKEFFDLIMENVTGTDTKFDMPGGEDWDTP